MIKIFPLSLTVLPGERQKLHIFEPRYQELMKDLMAGEWAFGIPFVKGGTLYRYGCFVEIIKTTSYDPSTGQMDIIVEGKKTFLLNKYLQQHGEKQYDSALIEWLDDGHSKSCEALQEEFYSYYNQLKKEFRAFNNVEKMDNIWSIVKFLPLTEDEKIKFISLRMPERRKMFLQNKIKELKRINAQAKSLGENIYYN
ncbi:MAG TPA: LON peptidase substrate-binding domain-containing protein [Bacteroidales bacterium]|nr:LON peptidase substrate-binding domain-containing protein [Bacteroidales bacterium]